MPQITIDLRLAFSHRANCPAPARPELRDDDLATPEDIARMTGMSLRWVYETFSIPAKGGIKPMKIGNKSRWYWWEVKAWTNARHRESASR